MTDQDGYIPIARHSGSPRCPWKIAVDPLQRLDLTLYAFGLAQPPSSHHPPPPPPSPPSSHHQQQQPDVSPCPWSLVIEEGSHVTEENLCRVGERQTPVYTSRTHSVTVYVLHKQSLPLPHSYLLKYEGW